MNTCSTSIRFQWIGLLAALIATAVPASADPAMTRDQRIAWWRGARFGMFIHWGLYAIPAGTWKDKVHKTGYSEWIMFDEKIPAEEYRQLASKFNPVRFNANQWAAIAKKAGMKYVVLTAKHHDGFSMYDSKLTDYDVVDATPFKRDVTRELANASRAAGLKFGCYYSDDRDWYRAMGPGNSYKQTNVWDYPDSKQEDFDRYLTGFAKPQIEELLVNYAPDLLWFDGIDMKNEAQAEDLYQTIRRLRPSCVINSRIRGCRPPKEMPPPQADYLSTGDNEVADRNIGFEWENPGSTNTSYGFNANDQNWVPAGEIIHRLVDIVSKGGNYLLNVGPDANGVIPKACVDHLAEVGDWMDVNAEAIHGTMPWKVFRDNDGKSGAGAEIRFTAKGDSVYAICMKVSGNELSVRNLGKSLLTDHAIKGVRMLGVAGQQEWKQTDQALVLPVPPKMPCRYAVVYRIDFESPAGQKGRD